MTPVLDGAGPEQDLCPAHHRRAHVVSLRGVSLDVAAGEHVAVAGPNGAGKSSLLRCVHRTYLPDSGSIKLHLAGGPVDADRRWLTGRWRGCAGARSATCRNSLRRRRGRGRSRWSPTRPGGAVSPRVEAGDAAAESLRRLGLDEALWDVDCGVLSGGERQRINLAAGTVRPPRLLLLDEPVSALDPANRELALSLVSSLTSQGVAVLAVFHDLDAIRQLATRVIRLEDGQVAASGTTDEILGELEAVS